MTLEEQVTAIAVQAANERWGLPDGLYGSIKISRLEHHANGWTATYTEPDTGSDESVFVRRVGNELHAYTASDDIPHIWTLREETE